MANRLDLQTALEDVMPDGHVYYQPPANVRMKYPCIRYSVDSMDIKYANDKKYIGTKRYEIIVIDLKPDNPAIDAILEMPLTSFSRHYVMDGLNHDVIEIYY